MRSTYDGSHVRSSVVFVARRYLIAAVLLVITCIYSSSASALTPAEIQDITNHANYIVSCQLTSGDGAGLIDMDNNPNNLWGNPYFANLAAIGLCRAYQATGTSSYLTAVANYINWYQLHRNTNGTVNDYDGTWASPHNTGGYDSTDSYAATYLMLLWVKYQADGNLTFLSGYRYVAENVYNAMLLTWQSDGLTWGKPGHYYKYLEDNIEVRAGLRAAYQIFNAIGDTTYRNDASAKLATNRTGLAGMYSTPLMYFGRWKDSGGTVSYSFSVWYPDGQCNAMALSYLGLPGDYEWNVLAGWNDWYWAGNYDYWRWVALNKWGYTTSAATCRANMPKGYPFERAHYIRTFEPFRDNFFYTQDQRPLPGL